MSQRCKFIDGQGEPIGHAEVPPMYGVVLVNDRYYGRMFNGDEDKDKFPFIFAEADVLVVPQLEELKYEPSERERKGAAGTRSEGSQAGARRGNSGRVGRNQLKANRGRTRGTY